MKFIRDFFELWWRPKSDASGPPIGLLLGMFFTYIGIGMVWSILTVYATTLGASAATAGATISAFGVSRLMVSIPAGLISERLGRVRVMMTGLLLVAASSFTALAVHNMPMLLACLMLQGVGSACYGTAALSAVTDRGTPTTRVRDMAAYQTATQIGLSFGPGLGGFAAALWGYGAPFACQGAMALIAFVAVMRIPGDTRKRPASIARTGAGGLFALIAGVAALSYALFFSRVASSWILMPLIAHGSFGMSIGTIGALLTTSAIANLAILRFMPWLVRRYGRFAVMIGATTTVLVALATLGFATSWSDALAVHGPHGDGHGHDDGLGFGLCRRRGAAGAGRRGYGLDADDHRPRRDHGAGLRRVLCRSALARNEGRDRALRRHPRRDRVDLSFNRQRTPRPATQAHSLVRSGRRVTANHGFASLGRQLHEERQRAQR